MTSYSPDYQDIDTLPNLSGILFNNVDDDAIIQAIGDDIFSFQDGQEVCVLTTTCEADESYESQEHLLNNNDGGEDIINEEVGNATNEQPPIHQGEGRSVKNKTRLRKCKRLEEKISAVKRDIADMLGQEDSKDSNSKKHIRSCSYCHLMYMDEEHEKEHCASGDHLLNVMAEQGTKKELLAREERELGTIILPKSCSICKKVFPRKREFLTHHRRLHSYIQPYQCVRCDEKFYRRCDLLQHIRMHLDLRAFKCRECPKSFNQQLKLESHLIHQHNYPDNRLRRYKCTECEQLFISKSEVDAHMKVHTHFKNYVCDECGRRFTNRTSLNAHRNLHTGETPYSCDQCDYKAKTLNLLKRHQRRHTGERPYHCNICEYAASSSSGLKRHLNQHLAEKPFHCPYCTYKSSTIENIRKHIKKTKKHKGLFVYPCKLCSYASDDAAQYIRHMQNEHGSIGNNASIISGMLQQQLTSVTITKPTNSNTTNNSRSFQHTDNGGVVIMTSQEEMEVYKQEEDGGDMVLCNVTSEPTSSSTEVDDTSATAATSSQPSHTIDLSLLNAIMSIPNLQKIIFPAPQGGDGEQASLTLIVADGNQHDGDDVDHTTTATIEVIEENG